MFASPVLGPKSLRNVGMRWRQIVSLAGAPACLGSILVSVWISRIPQIKLAKVKCNAVHSSFISATVSRLITTLSWHSEGSVFESWLWYRLRCLRFFEVPFMSLGQRWNGDNAHDPPCCTGSTFKVLVLFQRACAFMTFTKLQCSALSANRIGRWKRLLYSCSKFCHKCLN